MEIPTFKYYLINFLLKSVPPPPKKKIKNPVYLYISFPKMRTPVIKEIFDYF